VVCNTLQHNATHCNTLQHIATHTATHCNTAGPARTSGHDQGVSRREWFAVLQKRVCAHGRANSTCFLHRTSLLVSLHTNTNKPTNMHTHTHTNVNIFVCVYIYTYMCKSPFLPPPPSLSYILFNFSIRVHFSPFEFSPF